MKCPVCKRFPLFPKDIGAIIGGRRLTACPECGVVFCREAIEKKK